MTGSQRVLRPSRLSIARGLLVIGLVLGLISWKESIDHIGAADFLVPGYALGATHAWYHVFREAGGDVAKMAVFLLLFFGPSDWRTPVTWWIGLILMLGYYAPYWIGEPLLAALSAPVPIAGWVHLATATFVIVGHAVARPAFIVNQGKPNG